MGSSEARLDHHTIICPAHRIPMAGITASNEFNSVGLHEAKRNQICGVPALQLPFSIARRALDVSRHLLCPSRSQLPRLTYSMHANTCREKKRTLSSGFLETPRLETTNYIEALLASCVPSRRTYRGSMSYDSTQKTINRQRAKFIAGLLQSTPPTTLPFQRKSSVSSN